MRDVVPNERLERERLASERALAVQLDAVGPGSVLIAPGWTGPVVLGYRGFLERLRFALDPGSQPEDAWFFFGSAG